VGWSLRNTLSLTVVVLLLASLSLNAALIVSDTAFRLASGAVSAATGLATVAQRATSRLDNLRRERDRAETDRDAARRQHTNLEHRNTTLTGERNEARLERDRERQRADGLETERTRLQQNQKAQADRVRAAKSRVHRRIVRTASVNVASSSAEATPIIGIFVVAAVTAWELKESCSMLEDLAEMTEAMEALDPTEAGPDDQGDSTVICGVELPQAPSAQELFTTMGQGATTVWTTTLRQLEELAPELELPDWVETSRATIDGYTRWIFSWVRGQESTP
jgi:hypothetical protein